MSTTALQAKPFVTSLALDKAGDYAQWAAAAQALDLRDGAERWRDHEPSDLYDHRAIRARLELLQRLRREGDDAGLLFALNEGIHGNQDGIANERLWQRARFGTKRLIHDYIDAVAAALRHLAGPEAGNEGPTLDEKRDFFERAALCHGRSALLLSGAGAYMHFHVGVARALLAEGLLPRIVAGSSGGALVGAMLCTHSEAELADVLRTQAQQAFAAGGANEGIRGSKGGSAQGGLQADLLRFIEAAVPDLTFRQAFERSGRHLAISVAATEKHQNSRLLSAVTSPQACIREAVLASCAVPLMLPPVTLMARDAQGRRVPFLAHRQWMDGSVSHDLPTRRLSRVYGVNHSIVSQANPLVTPFAAHMRSPRSPLERVQRTAGASFRDWTILGLELMERPLSLFAPRLQPLAELSQSLINQDYSGDIDIVRPMLYWPPGKVLSQPGADDISKLIDLGERTTWPRLELIRLQTRISRELDGILGQLEEAVSQAARRAPAATAHMRRRR